VCLCNNWRKKIKGATSQPSCMWKMAIKDRDVMDLGIRQIRVLYSNLLDTDANVSQDHSSVHSTAKETLNNYSLMSLYTKHLIRGKVLVQSSV